MSNPHDTNKAGSEPKRLAEYTPEERAIIQWVERDEGRELTEQEAHLALEQARDMGVI